MGPLELLKCPGVFAILTKGEPAGGPEGSTVNHFGFIVPSVDEVKARLTAVGLPTVQELTNPKRWGRSIDHIGFEVKGRQRHDPLSVRVHHRPRTCTRNGSGAARPRPGSRRRSR